MTTLFTFNHVSKHVLSDLSFTIDKQDRVMLLGPSGAGKSTLLHLFNRMTSPDSGEVYYKGKSIEEMDVRRLRKNVGLLMQSPNLFPGTVYDNLKYGPELFGEWEEQQGTVLLERVQLSKDYLHRSVDQLSGGEQQRVSLARTLANKPDMLLLDEPTSALDQRTIDEIEGVLLDLLKENEMTMVMITHDMEQAKRLGTRALYVEDGQLLEEGALPNLFDQPKTTQLQQFLS
ncbi:phosphate ABC transporter ATP-binding protein [Pontibacillus halophilus JSM 076056 = DSM 19796]|uniref:Phosphate ABC transporter ATP-binding protein n=1 Tax=Pontibacillus halophilus JSM 076056 = DSM 19796 TaxID=1385510 RepID=A0A0A5I4W2_9BACI|nr:phosphate ABC transporter ATP-binding protein [Pontibacillus halophilus]KGX90872.1 phosphate ABC transporter ATP-binding protein [Pontibacillus halophilus JSM 076056 = DSM 19796]